MRGSVAKLIGKGLPRSMKRAAKRAWKLTPRNKRGELRAQILSGRGIK